MLKCCSLYEQQLLFWLPCSEKSVIGSKKSIFDVDSSKILELMSKNEFFDQLFQISDPDTQRKSCSSWKMLYENGVDEVGSWFPHRYLNHTKKVKIFKISPTSRGHRNFFTGRKNLIPTVLRSSLHKY